MCSARVASYHSKQGTCSTELLGLSGFLTPSAGHSRRVCRILRSEYWCQARFFKDCHWVSCGVNGGNLKKQRRLFSEMSKIIGDVTMFLWQRVRRNLPKKQKAATASGRFTNLGDIQVPPKLKRTTTTKTLVLATSLAYNRTYVLQSC